MGRLRKEDIKKYLGYSLSREQFKKTARTFLELHLAKIDYSSKESEIEFKLL